MKEIKSITGSIPNSYLITRKEGKELSKRGRDQRNNGDKKNKDKENDDAASFGDILDIHSFRKRKDMNTKHGYEKLNNAIKNIMNKNTLKPFFRKSDIKKNKETLENINDIYDNDRLKKIVNKRI